MRQRGINSRYVARDVKQSFVCECNCHSPNANILHFRPCCEPPKTPVEHEMLECYEQPIEKEEFDEEATRNKV